MECRVGGNLNRIQNREVMDTLKGVALVIAFLGFLATCATWIHIWDSTWQAAVEPIRGAIYETRLNRLAGGWAPRVAQRKTRGDRRSRRATGIAYITYDPK
jgi:hypothetical protein